MIPLMLVLWWCSIEHSAEYQQEQQTDKILSEINRQVGMPAITNFQEKKLAKMIFELRDREDLSTYTYIVSDYNGTPVFFCNSIGYWLPYSVQYTNPMKYEHSWTTLPQADPNWLYMPDWLSATWVMCNDNWEVRPVYVEPQIIVSPFKL